MLRILSLVLITLILTPALALASDAGSRQVDEPDNVPGLSHELVMRMLLSTILHEPEGEDDPARRPSYTPYDPWQALESARGWRVTEEFIPVPRGMLRIEDGWMFQPGGIDFDQYIIAGDLSITLDSLPPNSGDYLNIFDYRNPGQPVVFNAGSAFVCAGGEFALAECELFSTPAAAGWSDVPGEVRDTLAETYILNYHECGWLENYDFSQSPEAGELPYILRPSCGYPIVPEPGIVFLNWRMAGGETWTMQVDDSAVTLCDATYGSLRYVRPLGRPLVDCSPVESKQNHSLESYEYWVEYHRGNPDDWDNDPTTCAIRSVHHLIVEEPSDRLYFSLPRGRTCLGVTDGEGTELAWEDEFVKLGQPRDLVVHAGFLPGREYRIEIVSEVDGKAAHNSMGPELYMFEVTRREGNGGEACPTKIGVRLDCGEVNYLAAPGATLDEVDGWMVAEWPAGASRFYIAATADSLLDYEADGIQLHCLCEPGLADQPELTAALEPLARWLALRRDVSGPWTYDEVEDYLVQPGGFFSASDPAVLHFDPAGEFGYHAIWRLSDSSLDKLPGKPVQYPDCWRSALLDLLMYRSEVEFSDVLNPGQAEQYRRDQYRCLFERHISGSADDLLAMGLESELRARTGAALLAIDHESPELLYGAVLHPLRRRGLEQGSLNFAEISDAFMAQPGTPVAEWWRRLVLEGENPVAGTGHDPALPGVTGDMLKWLKQKSWYTAAVMKRGSDPAGIAYVMERSGLGVDDYRWYWIYIEALYYLGRYQEALDALDAWTAAMPATAHELDIDRMVGMNRSLCPACLVHLGRTGEARRIIADALTGMDPEEDAYDIESLEKFLAFIDRVEEGK